jgi:hypothetical protein
MFIQVTTGKLIVYTVIAVDTTLHVLYIYKYKFEK